MTGSDAISEDALQVVCVTPIRNEAWILDKFLACTNLWADQVVVLDQRSDDGSREIACRHPKVILEDYAPDEFDEPQRRGRLFEIARRLPIPRLLLALDADEFLSADFAESAEWEQVRRAPAGTVIRIERLGILPGAAQCWSEGYMACGLVDDGTPFETAPIHGPRIPHSPAAPVLDLKDIKMLHYQFMDWQRMRSKHRWYECWELLHSPQKRPITLYRQYHRMEAVPKEHLRPVAAPWLDGYLSRGIDMKTVAQEPSYRWDKEVLALFAVHGTQKFRRLDVWDADWSAMSRQFGCPAAPGSLRDPRSAFEKAVHRWLKKTQAQSSKPRIRWMQRALIPFGW